MNTAMYDESSSTKLMDYVLIWDVKERKGLGQLGCVSGCGRFMPFWKIGNPSFTPLNQGPDRFVAVEHAMPLTPRMQVWMPGMFDQIITCCRKEWKLVRIIRRKGSDGDDELMGEKKSSFRWRLDLTPAPASHFEIPYLPLNLHCLIICIVCIMHIVTLIALCTAILWH